MLYTQDRCRLRRIYCQAWRKFRDGKPLEPLERMIAAVVQQHPEYHALLENQEAATGADFAVELGESNPFLHLSLHLTIREQLGCNLPPGVTDIYQTLTGKVGDPHEAEHRMMECLASALWKVQRGDIQDAGDEYLSQIKILIKQ